MSARFRLGCVFAFLTLLFVSAAPPDGPLVSNPKDIEAGHCFITPAKLKMHLSFIASDELEGRDTPSNGLNSAARYIASHLEYYGYQPAGDDGSFYQKIPMTRRKVSRDSKVRIQCGEKSAEFAIGTDYVASGSDTKGKLVFAGYGLVSKEADYDDYDGLDVKDKLVVILDGFPEGIDAKLFQVERKLGNRTFQQPANRPGIAKEHGAIGTLTIRNTDFSTRRGNQPSMFEQLMSRVGRESSSFDFMAAAPPATAIDLQAESAGKLAEVLALDFDSVKKKIAETKKPVKTEIDASFEATIGTVEKTSTQNVVAFLEGSDAKLKDEIVLFSAHYDHVGVYQPGAPRRLEQVVPVTDDRIFNGADDDGSGTVGILNLAEAFAGINRPRRSLLFVWHCGEEKGLIGSSFYVQHPTKPLDKIVTDVNIDMIGRNSQDKDENANHVFAIGARKTSQELTDLVYQINGDRMRVDETDTGNFFMRSDHFNYARNKIPVVFFFTGVHKDYHRVSDEVQFILFDKMKKILDIIFECGLELANRDARPAFTGQGF